MNNFGDSEVRPPRLTTPVSAVQRNASVEEFTDAVARMSEPSAETCYW